MSYLSILMALIVIEMLSLVLFSSIVTTNQATEHSSKTTVATRIAQGCMENAVFETKNSFDTPLVLSELKCDSRKGYVPEVTSEVYSDGTTVYTNLRLVVVKLTYNLPTLSGKAEEESIVLKRLVSRGE